MYSNNQLNQTVLTIPRQPNYATCYLTLITHPLLQIPTTD